MNIRIGDVVRIKLGELKPCDRSTYRDLHMHIAGGVNVFTICSMHGKTTQLSPISGATGSEVAVPTDLIEKIDSERILQRRKEILKQSGAKKDLVEILSTEEMWHMMMKFRNAMKNTESSFLSLAVILKRLPEDMTVDLLEEEGADDFRAFDQWMARIDDEPKFAEPLNHIEVKLERVQGNG